MTDWKQHQLVTTRVQRIGVKPRTWSISPWLSHLTSSSEAAKQFIASYNASTPSWILFLTLSPCNIYIHYNRRYYLKIPVFSTHRGRGEFPPPSRFLQKAHTAPQWFYTIHVKLSVLDQNWTTQLTVKSFHSPFTWNIPPFFSCYLEYKLQASPRP